MINQEDFKISVIIPAYNAGKHLSQAIDSALAQTLKPYEVIVVDDGSSDDTCKEAEYYGDSIRLYRNDNNGVSYTRNFAVSKACGDWIAFLDSDDIWEPDKLATQTGNLKGNKWSHTNSYYIGHNQGGTTTRSDLSPQYDGLVFDKLLVDNFITTSTVLIDKELFLKHGGFDESMEALEDWKLWLVISKTMPIAYCNEPLARYRVYPGSTSRRARHILPMHIKLINEIFSDHVTKSVDPKIKKVALAQSYSICSYISEDSEDYIFSLTCALHAAHQSNYSLKHIKRAIRTCLNLHKLIH